MNIKLPLQIVHMEDMSQNTYIIEDADGQKVAETYDSNIADVIFYSIDSNIKNQKYNKGNMKELDVNVKELFDKTLLEIIDTCLIKIDDKEGYEGMYALEYKERRYDCPDNLGLIELDHCISEDGKFACKECWINALRIVKTQL